MLRVRLADRGDEPAIFSLGRRYVEEATPGMPGMHFDEARARESFDAYLATANPTVFVADRNGEIVGFLVASMQPFLFMYGLWTHIELIYVTPEKRGTRAAAELIACFDDWSERIRSRLSIGGNANKLHTERTASLYGKLGYEPVGVSMAKFRSG